MVAKLRKDDVEMRVVHDIKHDEMPLYMNASDVLLLISLWEGSPNVVKEAMACDIEIVSTDIGDVKQILNGFAGCYVSQFKPASLATTLLKTFNDSQPVRTRQHLIDLHVDSYSIALRLRDLYKTIVENK